jgi:hypothetical protein
LSYPCAAQSDPRQLGSGFANSKKKRLELTWYERIGTADPVDTYYVEQIDEAEAYGSCGFVYETLVLDMFVRIESPASRSGGTGPAATIFVLEDRKTL